MGVHNAQETVARAIQSIQRQTYRTWWLIVVDDGSSDGTGERLAAIAAADARVQILTNPRRRGLAASLNQAWRATDAALLARMDADDISDPERFERQLQFMRTHPEVAVLGTGARLIRGDGTAVGVAHRPASHDDLVAVAFRESPFFHPSVMMRKSFLVALDGYDERLPRAQDQDLWFRGIQGGFRFANLHDPLITYTVRDRASLTSAFWGAYVLFRSGIRAGRFATGTWSALRFAAAVGRSRVMPLLPRSR
jgi:glycosyltransferase involved in cell wall biosynthesis